MEKGLVSGVFRTKSDLAKENAAQVGQASGGLSPRSARPPVDASAVSAPALRSLFEEQQRFLTHFFENVKYSQIEAFAKAVLHCQGKVLFSGVGKSGFIAQKICQTLVSTGTKAVFLHPVDALHGDIGIVSQDDLLVLFSKSGATEELLRLAPFAKAKGARLVSVTSQTGSALDALCDLGVQLPLERELCPFNLAPVTSTALQMLFGDTVAVAIMQARQLSRDEYAQNHPAGRIGRRLMLRASDVMLRGEDLPVALPDMVLSDALMELTSKGCGCVLVCDRAQNLLGIYTDGDLRRTIQSRGGDIMGLRIGDIMTRDPRRCCPDAKAVDAMKNMEASPKVSAMPVQEGPRLVGLITLHALVSAGL